MDIAGNINMELAGELTEDLVRDPVANIFCNCSKTVKLL
jgi:hypothetical protein